MSTDQPDDVGQTSRGSRRLINLIYEIVTVQLYSILTVFNCRKWKVQTSTLIYYDLWYMKYMTGGGSEDPIGGWR